MVQEFWPTTPYALTLTFALAVATVLACLAPRFERGVFKYRWNPDLALVSSAMWVAWVFARLGTFYDNPFIAFIGIFYAVLFLTWRNGEIGQEIAYLYVPRIVCLAAGMLGILSSFWMWEISKAFLILQIAVLGIGGYESGRRVIAGYGSRPLVAFLGRAVHARVRNGG